MINLNSSNQTENQRRFGLKVGPPGSPSIAKIALKNTGTQELFERSVKNSWKTADK
jgi:hypothetical protein